MFSEFTNETEVAGIRFKGKFGVICTPPGEDPWCFAVGASTLKQKDIGFSDEPAVWAGKAESYTESSIRSRTKRPVNWPRLPRECQNYVLVRGDRYQTGFPIKDVKRDTIAVQRFPLQKVMEFELPALRFEWGR